MNRGIKFRGLSIDRGYKYGEWVYGSLVLDLDTYICVHGLPTDPELPLIRVDKKTVGQVLTDIKFKDGRILCEGDIFKSWDNAKPRQEYIHVVEWSGRHLGWNFRSLDGGLKGLFSMTMLHARETNIEIIGNIYQNPELMEDKK